MDDDATTIISLPPVINVAVKSIRCNPIVLRFLPTDNAVDFQIRPMIYNSLSLSVIIYYDNNTVNSQRSKKSFAHIFETKHFKRPKYHRVDWFFHCVVQ
mmetsp:Transcript_16027/g.18300  ORF Transcript_16027/g.18300 Transcript_16027/m.18300 type:complete len:99 (-) Transcript_16027:542-838(-)